jgi:putative ABC transport system substrate-binding protein
VTRRDFISLIGGAGVALLWALGAQAQQVDKVKRIGFLRVGPPPTAWIEGLRQGLRELGYIEGQNIAIEFALAPSAAQLPGIATQLIQLKPDVIIASGVPSVLPARDAAGTIPVVFVAAIDPVGTGLVTSLAHPGGNVTGLTGMQADITGKQLELLRELLPNASKIAVTVRAKSQAAPQYVQGAETAARTLGVQVQILTLHDPIDLEGIFSAAKGADALFVTGDAVFAAHRTQIAELALKNRVPTMHAFSDMVQAGGLMSYGPNFADLYRRAAAHVHKIFQGAKPANLPIEQPTKFELVLNVRTAKALRLTIPPTMLARADEVIE